MSDHRVVLADCLGPEGLATLADKSVDHVITDPPYDAHTHGAMRRGATGKDKRNGLGSDAISMERHCGFSAITDEEMGRAAAEFARVTRRWVLVFCAMEQQVGWMRHLVGSGLEHVRFGLWHKPGSTPQFTGDRPGTACEAIEIAHPPGRKAWNGGGRHGIWEFTVVLAGRNGHTEERVHTTQKPLGLMEALVRDFTDEGETVLDPFAGSGTTGVACRRLGRRFIGFERDAKYHAIAEKRIAGAREQMRMFEGVA